MSFLSSEEMLVIQRVLPIVGIVVGIAMLRLRGGLFWALLALGSLAFLLFNAWTMYEALRPNP